MRSVWSSTLNYLRSPHSGAAGLAGWLKTCAMVRATRSKDMDNLTITHKGWFFFIIPIYLDMRDESCPSIAGRHWIFEPFLMVMDLLFSAADYVAGRLFGAELTMPMLTTGEIGADGTPKHPRMDSSWPGCRRLSRRLADAKLAHV